MDPNRTVLTDQQIIGLVGQDIYDQTIFFPTSGDRSQSGGGMNDGGTGFYWSSSPRSATNGYSLLFGSGDVTPSYVNSHRASGFPVRCVKE